MRKFFRFLPLSFIMISCGLSEIGGSHSADNQGNVWGGPLQDNGTQGGGLVPVCYMSATPSPATDTTSAYPE